MELFVFVDHSLSPSVYFDIYMPLLFPPFCFEDIFQTMKFLVGH
jgi:hypothetical protein